MTYCLAEVPRVLTVIFDHTTINTPDHGSAERIDGMRAWRRMPAGDHRNMLAVVCGEDKTMTLSAAVCGLYPARARVTLEEAAIMLLIRLNDKRWR